MSNRPFEKKQELLEKSNVQLNKPFLSLKRWDERAIKERGRKLSEQIAKLWPRPEGAYVPGGGDDDTTDLTVTTSDLKALRAEYWREFVDVLTKESSELQPKDVGDKASLWFATGRNGAWLTTDIDFDEACVSVSLMFRGQGAVCNMRIIRQDEQAIEAELGEQVEWEDEDSPSRAALYLDSAQPANRSDWPRQHSWLAKNLRRLAEVVLPRVITHESTAFESKKVRQSFWSEINDQMKAAGFPVDLPTPKEKSWHGVALQSGVCLYFQLEPTENWLWCGLEFSGKTGHDKYERATKSAAISTLPVAPTIIAEFEEGNHEDWLGCYRLVCLAHRDRWADYLSWARETARRHVVFHENHVEIG